MSWTLMNVITSTLEMLGLCRASRSAGSRGDIGHSEIERCLRARTWLPINWRNPWRATFPKRADEKSWTDRELRLEELEAVSGGTTPAKHQQPREYLEIQLKEVFIS
jgi:hypothetical protein